MKKFLFLLSTILLMSPILTSCGHDDDNYPDLAGGYITVNGRDYEISFADFNLVNENGIDLVCLEFGVYYGGYDFSIYLELEDEHFVGQNRSVNMINESTYLWAFNFAGYSGIPNFKANEEYVSEINNGYMKVTDYGYNRDFSELEDLDVSASVVDRYNNKIDVDISGWFTRNDDLGRSISLKTKNMILRNGERTLAGRNSNKVSTRVRVKK